MNPLSLISRYTAMPRRRPAYRADRTHEEFVTNLSLPRLALVECLQLAWVTDPAPAESVNAPEATVRRLVAGKFGDPARIERL